MPLSIYDLRAGDYVVLNCTKARVRPRRTACFEAIYTARELRDRIRLDSRAILDGTLTAASAYAAFRMSSTQPQPGRILFDARSNTRTPVSDSFTLWAGFRLTDEGTLKDDENRTVIIERRLVRAAAAG